MFCRPVRKLSITDRFCRALMSLLTDTTEIPKSSPIFSRSSDEVRCPSA